MAELTICLLGPLQVTLKGEPVTGFETEKAQALLAYLAAEADRPQRREFLAEMLWPGRPQGAARANLRHTLAGLRRTIGDRRTPAVLSFLLTTRQTIQFNNASDAWVDAGAFMKLLEGKPPHTPPPVSKLEHAVELYRGPFLEDVSVSDSAAFHEWVLLKREQFRRQASNTLCRLARCYEIQGRFEQALQHARRQLELEPWDEGAHRQVMRLLALSEQRGAALAQYEACRRLLAQELGVEPEAETTALWAQIRDGELEIPSLIREPSSIFRRPVFLEEGVKEVEPPVFVARERELARLDSFLEAALQGQGSVVFVTGEAGQGKTALLGEFARRAMAAHPDLLVAKGNCSALAGVGDPYLPFRDVMAMLTGDVEARWAVGAISREQARRLWGALPLTLGALMQHGPHLVNVLVSGSALLSRAQIAAAGERATSWLADLRAYVARQGVQATRVEQSQLQEQFANTLRALSRERPLLLLVDDMQWAGRSSIALLFHLGRHFALAECRILITCSYRPEEVALGHPEPLEGRPDRHPLEKVLAEFKRQFGDAWLDLGWTDPADGHRFVDAYLDDLANPMERNHLDAEFREALFRHTEGHPLFTVELLRALQEQGALVQDDEGCWVVGAALEWRRLPPRVEGVIEERIGRLEGALREILTIASVEGEVFTAQVVAQVQGLSERDVLRALSQKLERRHHLVREQGELAVAGRRLSRYRFTHVLFQNYLYQGLSAGERRLLHREVAAVLEALYAGHTEDIAVPLAHHYRMVGDADRERAYAQLAGELAAGAYANAEALHYLGRALALTPKEDSAGRWALLLAREQIYDRLGERTAQNRDLEELGVLSAGLNLLMQAQVALRRAKYAQRTTVFAAASAAAQEAVWLAQTLPDSETSADAALRIEAEGHYWWGRALFRQLDTKAARARLSQALDLAQSAGARQVEADSLRILGAICVDYEQDSAGAEAFWAEALAIYREIGDRVGEASALFNLSAESSDKGDQVRARAYAGQVLRIARAMGHRGLEALGLLALSFPSARLGAFSAAQASLRQALKIQQEIGYRHFQLESLRWLGIVSHAQGAYVQARAYYQQALELSRETGQRFPEGVALKWLGRVAQNLGDQAEDTDCFEHAVHILKEVRHRDESEWWHALLLLSQHRNDRPAARDHAQQLVRAARDLGYRPDEATALTYLGDALAALEQFAEAVGAYRQALALRREMSQHHLAPGPLAGLARVALARDDAAAALPYVEEILSQLETGVIDGTDEPLRVYFTCYRVLQANDDPRAAEVLETAHQILQERAKKIDDAALRHSFLENVPSHRAILADWQSRFSDRQSARTQDWRS